jgi:hypothetical protein
MKHAGLEALTKLERLLAEIRKYPALREKKPGTFYRGAVAFLHFHEDPAGLFADLKVDRAFERSPVNTPAEHAALLRRMRTLLAA